VDWTKQNRLEIVKALFTILLGNPTLDEPRDAQMRTRFKMWWRLIGSAVENAAKQTGKELDFQKLFLEQEEDSEDDISLAETLDVLLKKWPETFHASDVSKLINDNFDDEDVETVRNFLYPTLDKNTKVGPGSVSKQLKKHIGAPVLSDNKTLVLKAVSAREDGSRHAAMGFKIEVIQKQDA